MSAQHTTESDAPTTCAGHSALGQCSASVRYVVAATGPERQYAACGRHVSWLLDRVLSEGELGTVTRVTPPGSCGCPTSGFGYRHHRHPCPRAGENERDIPPGSGEQG